MKRRVGAYALLCQILHLDCQNKNLVETQGLEPWTPCLQSRCSSQLSYVPDLMYRSILTKKQIKNKGDDAWVTFEHD